MKPTLVLDLDSTLVTGKATKRPGLDEFLERLSGVYDIVVFTASNQARADRIIDLFMKKYVGQRLYGDSCVRGTKPLGLLRKDLKKVVIIDDNPETYVCNEENGLPIVPFSSFTMEEEEREKHLLKVIPFLEEISCLDDLRPSLKQWKKTHNQKMSTEETANLFSGCRAEENF